MPPTQPQDLPQLERHVDSACLAVLRRRLDALHVVPVDADDRWRQSIWPHCSARSSPSRMPVRRAHSTKGEALVQRSPSMKTPYVLYGGIAFFGAVGIGSLAMGEARTAARNGDKLTG